jgi:hypothetical protein
MSTNKEKNENLKHELDEIIRKNRERNKTLKKILTELDEKRKKGRL